MEGDRLAVLGRTLKIIREDYCFITYILFYLYQEFSSVLLKLIMTHVGPLLVKEEMETNLQIAIRFLKNNDIETVVMNTH